MHFRDCVQLELALDDVRLQRVVLPWNGQSPRVLTAAYARFKLTAQGGGHEVDPRQFDLFAIPGGVTIPKKRGPIYDGAPTLRRLPKRS